MPNPAYQVLHPESFPFGLLAVGFWARVLEVLFETAASKSGPWDAASTFSLLQSAFRGQKQVIRSQFATSASAIRVQGGRHRAVGERECQRTGWDRGFAQRGRSCYRCLSSLQKDSQVEAGISGNDLQGYTIVTPQRHIFSPPTLCPSEAIRKLWGNKWKMGGLWHTNVALTSS